MKKIIYTLLFSLIGVLPAHISYGQIDTVFKVFKAVQVDDGVLINFTLRGGVTCSGVKIQKSSDGILFNDVFEFVGVCGAINTDESYSYTDTNPIVNSNSWYRLDLGSLGIYSDVINIKYIDYSKSGAVIFPNPCRENCTIYFSNKTKVPHQINIFDRSGKLVIDETTTEEQWLLPSDNFESGMYFYFIYRNGEERYNGKIMVL